MNISATPQTGTCPVCHCQNVFVTNGRFARHTTPGDQSKATWCNGPDVEIEIVNGGRFYVAQNELGFWCAFRNGHAFSNPKHTRGEAQAIAERFNDHVDAGRI